MQVKSIDLKLIKNNFLGDDNDINLKKDKFEVIIEFYDEKEMNLIHKELISRGFKSKIK